MKNRITLLLFFLFGSQLLIAKNSISIKDTIIPVGNTYEIPVFGDYNFNQSGKIKLSIIFNALNLEISGVKEAEGQGFKEITTEFLRHKWDSVELVVASDNYALNYNGILFYLIVQTLVGPDSLTLIRPVSLRIGNEEIDCEFKSGTIRTKSPIVEQKYIESISLVYPNPFDYEATVNFIIEEETKVEIHIFNNAGMKVFEFNKNTDEIRYSIFNEKDEKIEHSHNLILDKGRYKIVFSPQINRFSSGLYYLVLKTKKGTYKTNFIYNK
jgi:hypothetical protein